jgi:hypothetical protein
MQNKISVSPILPALSKVPARQRFGIDPVPLVERL